MNSTTSGNDLYTYHIITNAEFTGVIDKYKVHGYLRDTESEYYSNIYDYHLFIKYGNKVYMDVKGVGDIVISFTELNKNKYWKHYYDLSLMLTNNKHLIIQDLEYNSYYIDPYIYEGKRFWSINTAYIDGSYDAKTKHVTDNEYNCYYRINPYDLENIKSSQKDLNIFKSIYMSRYEVRAKIFDEKSSYYYNFVLDYLLTNMEKKLDELSTIFEDKKNLINLATFNDKKGMNNDILMIIYNNLVSADGNKKYKHIMTELETRNQLKSIAKIMAV
jgi:hypothetical protein